MGTAGETSDPPVSPSSNSCRFGERNTLRVGVGENGLGEVGPSLSDISLNESSIELARCVSECSGDCKRSELDSLSYGSACSLSASLLLTFRFVPNLFTNHWKIRIG